MLHLFSLFTFKRQLQYIPSINIKSLFETMHESYFYVRHYGTSQASAESDDLADPAEERRPGKRQRVEDAPEAAPEAA
jgi:hypothetical protein